VGPSPNTVDLVALLRSGLGSRSRTLRAAAELGDPGALLDSRLGLLAADARDRAHCEIEGWRRRGIEVVSTFDPGYPSNLLHAAEPPPLLFLAGRLSDADQRAIAVVGSRQASDRGLRATRAVALRLIDDGFTVVSGLAAGIDTAAHEAALAGGGRTVAVVGCGLDHCYPPENRELQRRIGVEGAVVSPFWPADRPARHTFPERNGVMARMALATVIVEASATSGTRIQGRVALDEGRRVLLLPAVLEQAWARELANRPGVEVVHTPAEVGEALARGPAVAPAN
jgi:DNA processing protein